MARLFENPHRVLLDAFPGVPPAATRLPRSAFGHLHETQGESLACGRWLWTFRFRLGDGLS